MPGHSQDRWGKLVKSIAASFKTYVGCDADDLEQEGRIAAWNAEAEYDADRGASLDTFVYMKARQAMIRAVAKEKLVPSLNDTVEAQTDSEEEAIDKLDLADFLLRVVTPLERSVLLHRFGFYGKPESVKTVSFITQMSEYKVRTTQHDAVIKIINSIRKGDVKLY